VTDGEAKRQLAEGSNARGVAPPLNGNVPFGDSANFTRSRHFRATAIWDDDSSKFRDRGIIDDPTGS
jgi:hypothetical protein